jgi:hypothetical protein
MGEPSSSFLSFHAAWVFVEVELEFANALSLSLGNDSVIGEGKLNDVTTREGQSESILYRLIYF